MYLFYGILMIVIGLFFLLSSLTKNENFLFKIFIDKSKPKWKDNVYLFYTIIGTIITILGILYSLNIFNIK